jgi:3-oxoacyl-[acyl-carrier-protein] synthase-1
MPAEILAIGMATPVGLCAAQTAASVRCGIGRMIVSHMPDGQGDMLVMGLANDEELPPLAEALEDEDLSPRHVSMAKLGGAALAETLAEEDNPIPLLLGVAEPRKEAKYPVGQEMLRILALQAGRELDLGRSRVYAQGRAAGLCALADAVAMVEKGQAQSVVVGGVDSYLDYFYLHALAAEGRLKAGAVSDGFVPGEGAAFALVAAPGVARRQHRRPLAIVEGVGLGREPGHRYSDEPHRGEGLAKAMRELFAAVPERGPANRIGCVWAGLNGESFWAKEWGVAAVRSAERFSEPVRIEHPADCMGDPGAAYGPIMLALATHDLARERCATPCLVWAASDREERAAVLLSPAPTANP